MPTLNELNTITGMVNNYNNYSNPYNYDDYSPCDYYDPNYGYNYGDYYGGYDSYGGTGYDDGFGSSFNPDFFSMLTSMFGQGSYGSSFGSYPSLGSYGNYNGGYNTGFNVGYGSNPMIEGLSQLFGFISQIFSSMFGGQGYGQGGYWTPGYWDYPVGQTNNQYDYISRMQQGQTFTVDLSNANLPPDALGKIRAGDKTGKSVYQVTYNSDGSCTMQGYSNHSGQYITRNYPSPEGCDLNNGEFSMCGLPLQIRPLADGTLGVFHLQYGQIGTASFGD